MNYTWNWIIFVIYCFVMVYIGYLGYKKTQNIDDYYVASRSFGLGVAIPLFAASFISSASIIGYTGFAYGYGWSFLIKYGLGVALGWIGLQIFSPKIYNSNYTWYTTSDLFCARYYDEKFMRGFQGLFNAFYMFIYVVIGLTGIGTIMEVFLGISYFWAVVIVATIFLAYTVTGGMYSVAWTNVVQFILLTIGVFIAAIASVKSAGGIANINSVIANIEGGITNLVPGAMHSIDARGAVPLGQSIGMAIGIGLTCPCAIYYHRIYFSIKSKKVAGSFVGISALILAATYIAIGLIGMAGRIIVPELANTEQVFPTIIMKLPFVLSALIVAGVISAIQSTLDNQLLSAGSLATHDLYNKIYNKNATEEDLVKVSRIFTLLIGIFATIIALIRPALVIELYNFIMILIPTVLFPPLLLGLFWKRTTREAGIFGCAFGLIAGLLWILFGPENIPATLVVLPINIILMIIVSKFTPNPPVEVAEKFF